MKFDLLPLPYPLDALEPHMSARTLEFHYGKHHQTYVNNLNSMIAGTDFQDKTLEEIVLASFGVAAGIFNNSSQHWNHLLFWKSMKKDGGGSMPSTLQGRIVQDFGSVEAFKKEFVAAGLGQFGSGWCWLVVTEQGRLAVTKTPNGENPLVHKQTALVGCDVWEHSYYLDYQNRRADYLNAFFESLIDWEAVAERLPSA